MEQKTFTSINKVNTTQSITITSNRNCTSIPCIQWIWHISTSKKDPQETASPWQLTLNHDPLDAVRIADIEYIGWLHF